MSFIFSDPLHWIVLRLNNYAFDEIDVFDYLAIYFNKMIEPGKIDEIVSTIVNRFNPEKVILFGSYAQGNPGKDSDLDLLIIQETDVPMHKRGFDVRMSLLGHMIPMDILIYTNSEFNCEKDRNSSFLNSVMKNSRLLYERAK